MLGEVEGRDVAFLARHGKGHRILPSELNFRANIYAMKKLGVTSILASVRWQPEKEHKPTDFIVPDQFIDRTLRDTRRSSVRALWAMWRLAIRSARSWRTSL